MWEGPNLFRALEEDWRHVATSPSARAALRRWAEDGDVLAGVAHPAALVERCHSRHDADARALLAAVIVHAPEEPLAARTVLHAVLPGLAAVSRRGLPFVGPGRVWERVDELDQHVVSVAYERIHALAPAPPAWLATALVDGTWQRVRWYAVRRRAERALRAPLAAAEQFPAPTPAAGQELADVLADAVEQGLLEQLDAWVVFESRVTGTAMPVLAVDAGVASRRLWRRRQRAEAELVAARARRARPMVGAGAV